MNKDHPHNMKTSGLNVHPKNSERGKYITESDF